MALIDLILNPSFESPGVESGQAEDWTEAYPTDITDVLHYVAGQDAAEMVATFGTGYGEYPYEGFVGEWQNNHLSQFVFVFGDLIPALFEGLTLDEESFEYSWALPSILVPGSPVYNHQSKFAYDSTSFTLAVFGSPSYPLNYEEFNRQWDDNEDSVDKLESGSVTSALFNTGTLGQERFEAGWQNNENFEIGFPTFGSGTLTVAIFDAINPYEDFEGVWTMAMV